MPYKGKTWKFGDNVNTDEIIPARYLNTSDPKELAAHVMEDADADFVEKMARGDIIVAGKNFGCGSSREHAPLAIKTAGISFVVAESFARIFYRNAFNIGLPIFESAAAAAALKGGEQIEVNERQGRIKVKGGKEYATTEYPDFMRQLIAAGGLMKYLKKRR